MAQGRRLALGLDFGTESSRALLVDVTTGQEVAMAEGEYPHGVVDATLPGTEDRLPPDWALQDPDDYLVVLAQLVPEVLQQSGATADQVIGIGVDFTACTLVPSRSDGTPLSRLTEHRSNRHAWTKLWKHHGAHRQAEAINTVAADRGEEFLNRYGGRTSSEWLYAKAWEMLQEAPDLFAQAERLIEAGDWLVWQLTGTETRSACQAGYKGMWSRSAGYPTTEFLAALDPALAAGMPSRLGSSVQAVGECAGYLTAEWAGRLGLRMGTPVGVSIIDAHAAVPAAGVTGPGTLLLILGTSGCHLVLGEEDRCFPGIAGVVQDGILPGWFGYEAGQPATGDILGWYARHAPDDVVLESQRRGISRHEVLTERAARLPPAGTGLVALDWWNGNRSVLMDSELSGVILGLTLDTRPEEIYLALIEATAFGTLTILENFERNGVEIRNLVAAGGLAEKNDLLMQTYADVTGRSLRVVRSGQACALGAAILGAVAAGEEAGGWSDLPTAARAMGGVKERTYEPRPDITEMYQETYKEWLRLHDYFGRGVNPILKRLRAWRRGG